MLLALVSVGCAPADSDAPSTPPTSPASTSPASSELAPTPTALVAGDTTLLVAGAGAIGFEAMVSGEVGVNDQGCVTIGGWLVVAPAGSTMTADGVIELAGYEPVEVGDAFEGAGGYFPVDDLVDPAFAACASHSSEDEEYALVSPGL